MYLYLSLYIYMYTYIYIYIHTYIHHVSLSLYMCVYIYIYTHRNMKPQYTSLHVDDIDCIPRALGLLGGMRRGGPRPSVVTSGGATCLTPLVLLTELLVYRYTYQGT